MVRPVVDLTVSGPFKDVTSTHPHTPPPPPAAEWSETSRLLFAADGAHRQLGVDRVQAWRARGRIPVAVDATAALLEVRAGLGFGVRV